MDRNDVFGSRNFCTHGPSHCGTFGEPLPPVHYRTVVERLVFIPGRCVHVDGEVAGWTFADFESNEEIDKCCEQCCDEGKGY